MDSAQANLFERAIVQALVKRDQRSVAAISRELSLPISTTVGVLNRLLEKRLICRQEERAISRRGRPSFRYGIRLPAPVAAFQFDGSQLSVGVFSPEMKMLASETVRLPSLKDVSAAAALARDMLYVVCSTAKLKPATLDGAGVAFNALRGRNGVMSSSVLPWVNHAGEKTFSQALGVRVRLVGAPRILAEHRLLDEAHQSAPFAMLHVGDGVSGHFVPGGQIYRGFSGRAGELGHISKDPDGPRCGCGGRGCIEAYCSGPAIRAQVAARAAQPRPAKWLIRATELSDPQAVVECVWQEWSDGDPSATILMQDVFQRLGWGLGLLINMIDPQRVIVGGYVLEGRDKWIKAVERESARWRLHHATRAKVPLIPARATLAHQLRAIASLFHHSTARDVCEE